MDTELSFKILLTTAPFSPKARDAIIEFCCGTLTELANLPRSDLDASIANLHKALSNVKNARDQVRLTATKILTLHTICIHFLDRINYAALLDAGDIADLTDDDLVFMRDNYLESTQIQDSFSSLVDNYSWVNNNYMVVLDGFAGHGSHLNLDYKRTQYFLRKHKQELSKE